MPPMTFGSSCEPSESNPYARRANRSRGRGEAQGEKQLGDPFEKIVRLCAVRDRSEAELRERLERDGYGVDDAESALSRAVACGLVNDARFADVLVRSRVSAGKGEQAIRRDLLKNGIEPESLRDWPDGYGLDEASQVERAVALLDRKPPNAKDAWSAAFRRLVGKGYSQAVATRAARLWSESREDTR